MRLEDILPILAVPEWKEIGKPEAIKIVDRIVQSPAIFYEELESMRNAVLVSYALYAWLYHLPEHRATGNKVIEQLHQTYAPYLQEDSVRDRTHAIILDEGDKIRIHHRDFSKADVATKARYHLISRAREGYILREAEHIYQAFARGLPLCSPADREACKAIST